MGVVGFIGLGLVRGWDATAAAAGQVVYETGFAYTLSVVPLFILMGNFVARAGLAHELFRLAYSLIGHLRGGLAHATILACAGFGAICGSSIATAATMSKVAYPSMKKLGYADYLSTGVIAGGGTLGIMIPPSTIMVIYGIVTETHIGKLFAAGVLPGLLLAALMMGAVVIVTTRDPQAGPAGERSSWRERAPPTLLPLAASLGARRSSISGVTSSSSRPSSTTRRRDNPKASVRSTVSGPMP